MEFGKGRAVFFETPENPSGGWLVPDEQHAKRLLEITDKKFITWTEEGGYATGVENEDGSIFIRIGSNDASEFEFEKHTIALPHLAQVASVGAPEPLDSHVQVVPTRGGYYWSRNGCWTSLDNPVVLRHVAIADEHGSSNFVFLGKNGRRVRASVSKVRDENTRMPRTFVYAVGERTSMITEEFALLPLAADNPLSVNAADLYPPRLFSKQDPTHHEAPLAAASSPQEFASALNLAIKIVDTSGPFDSPLRGFYEFDELGRPQRVKPRARPASAVLPDRDDSHLKIAKPSLAVVPGDPVDPGSVYEFNINRPFPGESSDMQLSTHLRVKNTRKLVQVSRSLAQNENLLGEWLASPKPHETISEAFWDIAGDPQLVQTGRVTLTKPAKGDRAQGNLILYTDDVINSVAQRNRYYGDWGHLSYYLENVPRLLINQSSVLKIVSGPEPPPTPPRDSSAAETARYEADAMKYMELNRQRTYQEALMLLVGSISVSDISEWKGMPKFVTNNHKGEDLFWIPTASTGVRLVGIMDNWTLGKQWKGGNTDLTPFGLILEMPPGTTMSRPHEITPIPRMLHFEHKGRFWTYPNLNRKLLSTIGLVKVWVDVMVQLMRIHDKGIVHGNVRPRTIHFKKFTTADSYRNTVGGVIGTRLVGFEEAFKWTAGQVGVSSKFANLYVAPWLIYNGSVKIITATVTKDTAKLVKVPAKPESIKAPTRSTRMTGDFYAAAIVLVEALYDLTYKELFKLLYPGDLYSRIRDASLSRIHAQLAAVYNANVEALLMKDFANPNPLRVSRPNNAPVAVDLVQQFGQFYDWNSIKSIIAAMLFINTIQLPDGTVAYGSYDEARAIFESQVRALPPQTTISIASSSEGGASLSEVPLPDIQMPPSPSIRIQNPPLDSVLHAAANANSDMLDKMQFSAPPAADYFPPVSQDQLDALIPEDEGGEIEDLRSVGALTPNLFKTPAGNAPPSPIGEPEFDPDAFFNLDPVQPPVLRVALPDLTPAPAPEPAAPPEIRRESARGLPSPSPMNIGATPNLLAGIEELGETPARANDAFLALMGVDPRADPNTQFGFPMFGGMPSLYPYRVDLSKDVDDPAALEYRAPPPQQVDLGTAMESGGSVGSRGSSIYSEALDEHGEPMRTSMIFPGLHLEAKFRMAVTAAAEGRTLRPPSPPERSLLSVLQEPKAELVVTKNRDALVVWGKIRLDHDSTYACVWGKGHLIWEVGNRNTVGRAWSVTKSLSVGYHAAKAQMEGLINVNDMVIDYINPTNPIRDRVHGVTLNMLLTQRSGLVTTEFGVTDIQTRLERMGKDLSATTAPHLVSGRTQPEGEDAPFSYDNAASQVAGIAFESMVRTKTNNPRYLIRDEAFGDLLRGIDAEWPYGSAPANPLDVFTSTFMGLSMTGAQMLEVGTRLVTEERHRKVLEFIYDWPHYAELPEDVYPGRKGWRYSFMWWIPSKEVSMGHRWLVCIGFMGQYIVIDLDNHVVGVRQHKMGLDDVWEMITTRNATDKGSGFVTSMTTVYESPDDRS